MFDLLIPALGTIALLLLALVGAWVSGLYLGAQYILNDEYEKALTDRLYHIGVAMGVASITVMLLTLAFVVPR